MKIALFIGFTLIIIPHWISAADGIATDLDVKDSRKEILLDTVIRKLKSYWIENKDDNDTVVGRCLGLAKKIRSFLPIAVFLTGVTMTLLVFLTMFSMKTLALVGLLLLVNLSAGAAKIGAAFAIHKEEKHPQTVHFHIHKDDDHHGYHIGHPEHSPEWDRTSQYYQEPELNKIESYNLYKKLLKTLSTSSY